MTVSRETARGISGWTRLAKLDLRQSRMWWLVWTAALGLEPLSVVATYKQYYPTEASRQFLQRTSEGNAGLNLLYGRAHDLTTAGGFTTWRIYGFIATVGAIATILFVIRMTRAQEEGGRAELVASAPVGRHAGLLASLTVGWAASACIAVVTAIGLMSQGAPASGSWAYGLGTGSLLAVWAAIAACVVQIFRSARQVRMVTLVGLLAAFLIRGVADASPESSALAHLTWLSPIGWAHQVRPFAGDRWWVIAFMVLVALALAAGAFAMESHRDVGEGLIADADGPANGRESRSPALLVARLASTSFLVWGLSLVLAGLVLGTIASSIDNLMGDTPGAKEVVQQMGGSANMTKAYFGAILPILALMAGMFGQGLVTQTADAEATNKSELVLSTPTPRNRWLGWHIVVSLLGAAGMVVVSALALALGARLITSDVPMPPVWDVVCGGLVLIPAVALVQSVGWLGWAATSRTAWGWASLGFVTFVAWLGSALKIPDWLLDISPHRHAPHLPGAQFTAHDAVVEVVLVAITLALLTGAFVAYRSRDIT